MSIYSIPLKRMRAMLQLYVENCSLPSNDSKTKTPPCKRNFCFVNWMRPEWNTIENLVKEWLYVFRMHDFTKDTA